MFRHIYPAVASAFLLGSLGCSSSDRVAYPVEFEVNIQGKPAAGAVVVFHPVAGADPTVPLPTGKVDPNGVVKLSTFAQNDGAPPGDYTITVEWRDEIEVVQGSDKLRDFSADKLKGKYKQPNSPTAPRATVQKQVNKLPSLQL